jgi:branched-chain amino acid aminotransferase
MTDNPVWVDGSLAGRIDPFDRGLLLGDGVFDTLVAFRGVPFAGARHLERLIAHAAAIGIALDPDRVRAGWSAVLDAAETEHSIVRTTVTRGVTGRGLWPASQPAPTIVVSATPWSADIVSRPVRLATSTIRRNAESPTSRLKAIGYLDNILAAREAAEKGADDALLLNHSGQIACTTIANVFAVAGDSLVTPPAADGVMPGIVRALVLEAASAAGLKSEERSLSAADLVAADHVFLTNSVRLLSPALSLDGRPLAARSENRVATLRAAIAGRIDDECGFNPLKSPRGLPKAAPSH